MATQIEAADVSKQLLTEPAAASLSELPYAPSLTFGQVPLPAEASQPPVTQAAYLSFESLAQSYTATPADPQIASLAPPAGGTATTSATILQPAPETLSGTEQAMLAAQHAMATARYSSPSHTLMQYPIATLSSLDIPEGAPALTFTGELQQAITQSNGFPADAMPGRAAAPLDPNRPMMQEADQASMETQDLSTSPRTKSGRPRRSVRKKRPRDSSEQTSRKTPAPITLAVTPVLEAIAQAQPVHCVEGDSLDCPGQPLNCTQCPIRCFGDLNDLMILIRASRRHSITR